MTCFMRWIAYCFLVALSSVTFAEEKEVTLAGFAFAGQHNEAKIRFPYTYKIFEAAMQQKRPLSRIILERAGQLKNPEITYIAGDLVSLKKGSQTLMAVLVLTGETVSTTCFRSACRVFVNLRGDAMIFDVKSHTIVRNYPISLNVFDVSQSSHPSDAQLLSIVSKSLTRTDENGIISQFFERLSMAKLPKEGIDNLNFQVSNVEVAPEALSFLPAVQQKDPLLAKNALSDMFSSIFASTLAVPMLPSRIGHAHGMMMIRLESGSDFELKIPKGDFLFDIRLTKFVKVKSAENEYGANYIYGAYANIRLSSDLHTYIDSDFRNGENAEVLSTQRTVDDIPAYQDALRGLFIKLSDVIKDSSSEHKSWLSTAASAKDVSKQIDKTRDIVKKLN